MASLIEGMRLQGEWVANPCPKYVGYVQRKIFWPQKREDWGLTEGSIPAQSPSQNIFTYLPPLAFKFNLFTRNVLQIDSWCTTKAAEFPICSLYYRGVLYIIYEIETEWQSVLNSLKYNRIHYQ